MSDQKETWIDEALKEELGETVATLTRLGTTLAGLPLAFLPRAQRVRAKQLTGELMRVGAIIPRTVGAMLDEVAEEWQGEEREDLGSRLRRAEREALHAASAGPDEEAEATEEIEEDIQDAFNDPPLEPGEQSDQPNQPES